jgi:hydroxymethylpyrimidine/phosphomethylpyrimidine kinase
MKDPTQQRSEVLEQVQGAVVLLERSMDARLIPAQNANIAYAITGARDKNGVAAVPGGITTTGTGIRASGPCAFGADESISRIVLTAMKFDPVMRSAAVLRYSSRVISVMEDMFLECRSFDASAKPPGTSTMDWGVASCCEEGVPDVIFDRSTRDGEPRIRLFGEDSLDVSNNIIMLSNRIIHIEL